MRLITIALLLLFSFAAKAQLEYYNSVEFWEKLKLSNKAGIPKLDEEDTCIVVASNRIYQPDALRYMTEDVDCNGVRYFFVYAKKGTWNIVPMKNLEEAISYIPASNKDWVVYTEGMGKLFTNDVERGMSMAGQYNVNILLLDYPSIRTDIKRIPNYRFAIYQARNAYKDFAPILDTVKQLRNEHKMGKGKLTLFFHSMGNNVISKIASGNELHKLNNEVWVDNLVLNAPCVMQRRHNGWLGKIKFAKHVYVHYNPKDHTLQGAHLLSLKKQLGEKVKNPINKKATYINFHTLVDDGHSNFLSLYGRSPAPPAAIRHYNTVLHGDTVNVYNNAAYNATKYKKIGWDIMP